MVLEPGESAVAARGRIAQGAAGEQRAGRPFVSVHPGVSHLAATADLDIKDGSAVALTAWKAQAE